MKGFGAVEFNSKRNRAIGVLFVGLTLPTHFNALAQRETVYIYGERAFKSEADGSGSSVSRLTQDDFQDAQTLEDVLRRQPGVSAVQSGWGATPNVYLRGGNASHLTVMIDGQIVNDPSSPNRAFDFSQISLDDVESIEIHRGSQSVLFGQEAMGGVISIRTRSQKLKRKVRVKAEAGSFATFLESAQVSEPLGQGQISVSGSRADSRGPSIATDGDADGYQDTDLSLNLRREWKHVSAAVRSRYHHRKVEGDGYDFMQKTTVDSGDWTRQKDLAIGTELAWSTPRDVLRGTSQLNYLAIDRAGLIEGFGELNYSGGRVQVLSAQEWEPHSKWLVRFGMDGNFERARALNAEEMFARRFGGYVYPQWSPISWFRLSSGARVEDHSTIGLATAWKSTAEAFDSDERNRLFLTYSEGLSAPTLQQLYGDGGNPKLKTERVRGWEVGGSRSQGRGNVQVSYFENFYRDLILTQWVPVLSYENRGRVTVRGIELQGEAVWSRWDVEGSLTFLQTRDHATGGPLPRRPGLAATGEVRWRPWSQLRLHSSARFSGSRIDNPSSSDRLDSYWVWSLGAQYQVTKQLRVFARLDNLLNVRYEDALGYPSVGLTAFTGLRFDL